MISKVELQDIADILRRDALEATAMAGSGHPSSCLSCAEIISCLFFSQMQYDVENPKNENNDEFILSKGHAAPILYSALFRAGAISHNPLTLRKLNSPLEGHPVPSSTLPFIKFATGSLGQGLSIGVGMALASKMQNLSSKIYVLLGDSECAEGSIYEALQLASYYKLNNLIAIIDVNRLGQTGPTMLQHDLKTYRSRFSSFGWNTIDINGHKISNILKALKKAYYSNQPTAIIAKTFKGNPISFIKDKNNWHGRPLSPQELEQALKEIPNPEMPLFNISKPENNSKKTQETISLPQLTSYSQNEQISTREAYGNALAALALSNHQIIAIDAETSNSTFSQKLKEKTPEQFIEAFIAEQNMIGMALGMSKKSLVPFASSFAAFLSRAHDQIRMAALSSPNLTICGSHAGVSIGEDGPSQMGLEDLALFRSLPNSIVFYPTDAVSAEKLIYLSSKLNGLKYIRTTRSKTPIIYSQKDSFQLGEFKILKQSSKDKAVLIGAGITLHESLKAHELLKKQKLNTAVIDLYCIKPINTLKLIKFIKEHGKKAIITEDHYKEGGIGEMLSNELKNTSIKLQHLAVTKIPHSGTSAELLSKYEIDAIAIEKAVKSF